MGNIQKSVFGMIILFSFLLSACANSRDESQSTEGEQLFFSAFEANGSEDLLLRAAETMSAPWSGLALYELSLSYLERPVPPSLGHLVRLWKRYLNRFGYDNYSRDVRTRIALLDGQNPDGSFLLGEGEGDAFYSYLFQLSRDKTEDFAPLYDYLSGDRDEGDLSFLLYYLGKEDLLDRVPAPFVDWLTLKQLVNQKEYAAATSKLNALDLAPPVITRPGYYRDAWRVILAQRDRDRILTAWERRADTLEGDTLWALLFYDGLCRRTRGQTSTAGALLERAIPLAPDGASRDRTLWYRLDCLEKSGTDLAAAIGERASQWEDPPFFEDLIERAVSSDVFRGDWESLLSLEETLALYGSSDSRDLIEWTVARAIHEGYVTLSKEEENRRYRGIVERSGGTLYTVMAEYISAGEIAYYRSLRKGGLDMDKGSPDSSLMEEVFRGFVSRRLMEASRSLYEKEGARLSSSSLREYAYLLRRNGDYLGSIRVIGALTKREGFEGSREDLTLLYPLEYAGSIEYWSDRYSLPRTFFQALVKTESGYDKDIVSYAGAIGLSQLMPATAEERMSLLGMDGADLTEPDVNIALGTEYLRWLFDREYINSPVQAAAAYNGGPGSVRKWNRAMEGYPPLLYMEGIPFIQTRDYVKSLLQGSLVYAFLYDDKPLEELLTELLPELLPEQAG
ncbi:MAG: lytic transglycosylase domain-containing protein [Spirochaetales bacterium]|nr:lytic transglycosylase domain-containing protein [Spirochaetales bacterium]